MSSLYFDYNSTTPVAGAVSRAAEPYFSQDFANAFSLHQMGQKAAKGLKDARRKAALLLNCQESEIVFTSGGTESNNTALRSALAANPQKKEIVISAVEHSSIRKLCIQLEKEGYSLREIPVDSQGRLNEEILQKALSERTAVVSCMLANNETGILFPVERIGKKVKEKGILFHVDAVQAVGKYPVRLESSSIDMLSLAAHKFYGPKGAGALYVKRGVPFSPLICGGGQERGRRAGTENIPAIVGLGAACELAMSDFDSESSRVKKLRDAFEAEIKNKIPDCRITGETQDRLVNTAHVTFQGIEAETLLAALDQRDIFASSGSACMSGSSEPSFVLKAMGFSDQEARSALRFSFGRETTEESVSVLTKALCEIIFRLREDHSPCAVTKGAYR